MMPNPIVISNRNIVFDDPKEFDDTEVCDGHLLLSDFIFTSSI